MIIIIPKYNYNTIQAQTVVSLHAYDASCGCNAATPQQHHNNNTTTTTTTATTTKKV